MLRSAVSSVKSAGALKSPKPQPGQRDIGDLLEAHTVDHPSQRSWPTMPCGKYTCSFSCRDDMPCVDNHPRIEHYLVQS
eukprot:22856-Eustigmatos_ZCMA.PRE.1